MEKQNYLVAVKELVYGQVTGCTLDIMAYSEEHAIAEAMKIIVYPPLSIAAALDSSDSSDSSDDNDYLGAIAEIADYFGAPAR